MSSWQLRHTDLEWRRIDDEMVVLDLRSGTYLSLNATGADLLESLGPGATTEDLVSVLTERYETTKDEARADVAEFLAELKRRGLVFGGD